MTNFTNISKAFAIAGFVGLSACGGTQGMTGAPGTGNSDGNEVTPITSTPVSGTSTQTLQTNLGAKNGTPITINGVLTQGDLLDGTFTANYGSTNNDGDTSPSSFVAILETDFGNVTTRIQEGGGTTKKVLDGKLVQVFQGDTDTIYVPSDNSDMQVGMFAKTNRDYGVTGIFGQKTTTAQMSNTPTTGTATYKGVTEFSIEDGLRQTTHGYRGDITADVKFNDQSIKYTSGTLKLTGTDLGGPDTVTVNGQATFNGKGNINGTYTANPQGVDAMNGNITGNFYGDNRQSMGILFNGDETGGGAILGK
jgi:hypothetical protein